jgi:plastocyanin
MRYIRIVSLIGVMSLGTGAGASHQPPGISAVNAPVQARATIKVSSFQFTPKILTIARGTTVEWINEGGRHSVVADDGSFKSDVLKQGDKFEHTFDKAGTFPYHCEFHGDKGGKDMAGKIVVKAR